MDIVEFLTRQLDEDEQMALLAAEAGRRADPRHQWVVEPFVPSSEGAIPANTWVVDKHEIGVAVVNGGYAADHIARHDPAHVLAEVAAKRAILALHEAARAGLEASAGTILAGAAKLNLRAYGNALRALAAVYSEHPDYDPSWDLASG